jgi:hypothetical protein
VFQEPPADDGPKDDAQPGHPSPDADGPAPLLGREQVGDDRQGGGHDQRRADPHGRPGGDQDRGGAGQGRRCRARHEDQQAGVEGQLAAEPVAQGPMVSSSPANTRM